MTPTQIEEAARRRYNIVGDTMWSQDEVFGLIYDACNQVARECLLIERTYETTTVAGTQEYAFPTNTIAIKRATYNGQKLTPINFREDDSVTGLNMATTSQGAPAYYFTWNYTISLRPIPDDVQTLKLWTYNTHSQITSPTATLEIPEEFHIELVNYVVEQFAAKDSNFNAAKYFGEKWLKALGDMRRWAQKRKRRDSFASVQDESFFAENFVGNIGNI